MFGSYGYEQDLFELAVLKKVTDDDYNFYYNSHIAKNVLGGLTNEEVLETLEKIKNLPEEDEIDEEEEEDSFEIFNQIMRKVISERKESIDKRNEELKDSMENAIHYIKTQRDSMKEIGQDMLDISILMDDYIDYINDPIKLCLDNNADKTLEKKANNIQMRVMILGNKLEAFTEILNDMNKEGEKDG